MRTKEFFPVFVAGSLLLLYSVFMMADGLSVFTVIIFFISPFLVAWMVYSVLRFGKYNGKSLDENFWAVFGSGITILGVESYRIWTFCAEGISKNMEDIEYVNRTGRPPPQE